MARRPLEMLTWTFHNTGEGVYRGDFAGSPLSTCRKMEHKTANGRDISYRGPKII